MKYDRFESLKAANKQVEAKLEEPKHAKCIIFAEECDDMLQLVKRVMYAEGDSTKLGDDCAEYVKQ